MSWINIWNVAGDLFKFLIYYVKTIINFTPITYIIR